MTKRILTVALVLLLCVTAGAFAKELKSSQIPWLVSYNSAGQSEVSVGAGWTEFGLGASATWGTTFGQFSLGPIPLSWGLNVVANAGFTFDVGIAAGAFIGIEWGFDFGQSAKFEFQVGIGPGLAFDVVPYWYSYWGAFGAGIGEYSSGTWWFSNNMGLTLQDVWVSTFLGPSLYNYTLGLEWKL